MTQPRSKSHHAHQRRTSGKNPAQRKPRREEFVIRTLKPITPPSLLNHRQVRARFAFSLPFLVVAFGIALIILHSVLSVGLTLVGVASLVIGVVWVSVNFRVGSPHRLIEYIAPATADHPSIDRLMNLLEGLCVENGLSPPKVRVMTDRSLNALVIGWNQRDATLLVTSGLLESCTRIELEGVIAHELAHVKRGDMRDAAFASVACGMFSVLSSRSARFANALLSPSRETEADIGGVSMTRYPPGLIQALSKISAQCAPPELLTRKVTRLSAPCWIRALDESQRNRTIAGDLSVQERIGLLSQL